MNTHLRTYAPPIGLQRRFLRRRPLFVRITDWLDSADSYPLRYIPIGMALVYISYAAAVGTSHIGDWLRDGGLARLLQMVRGIR